MSAEAAMSGEAALSRTKRELATCDERLRQIAEEALRHIPFRVVQGHRGEEDQNDAVAKGRSKTPWPESKHNSRPSLAFDFIPGAGGEVDWNDTEAFSFVAGALSLAAKQSGLLLRWGGDWNMNGKTRDQKFHDYGHVEVASGPE